MKKVIVLFISISAFLFVSCGEKENEQQAEEALNHPVAGGGHMVKVVDFKDAGQYTYIQVEEGGEKYWIAAPQMTIAMGEVIYFDQGMEMQNFHSKTLDKTFDKVLFVEKVEKNRAPATGTDGMAHPKIDAPHGMAQDRSSIKVDPIPGGKTVTQIFAEKNSLAGKQVKFRGQVTKFNADIMDRNWIHIQDGTGGSDDYDIIVTSDDRVNVGDIVVIEGVVSVNRDFGSGYTYPVMVEKAKLKKEGEGKTKI